MHKYVLISLLLIVPFCNAMYSDEDGEYVPSGGKSKRGRSGLMSVEQSSSSDNEDDSKHTRVSGQMSVQKGKLYAVDPSDPTKVQTFPDRNTFIKKYMRQLVRTKGITYANVSDQIQALWQAQDTQALRREHGELKPHCMQCPSCDLILESSAGENEVLKSLFSHWFFRQQHQPLLFEHMLKLLATNEASARSHFRAHGLPKAAVVPLPHLADQEVEPMDERDDVELRFFSADDGINPKGALQEEEPRDERDDMEEQQYNAIDHGEALDAEQANAKWYIVVTDPAQSHMLTVFEAPTKAQVVARYVASKIPHLSSESPEVKEQGKQLEQNEELTKQLMVQDAAALKKLVCPDVACDVMYTQERDNSAKSLSALFGKMALHHMQTHQIEPHNVLSQKATQLAAPSFEKAYANAK